MNVTGHSLAWDIDEQERKLLQLIVAIICPVFLVLTLYISWIQLPAQTRAEREVLPPQLARLLLEKKEPPKPVIEKKEEKKPEPEPQLEKPKPEPKVVEKLKPAPRPEPKVVEKPRPEPVVVEAPKPVAKKPAPEPRVVKQPEPTPAAVEQAREKVKTTGILAMSSELSKLSTLADSVQLDTPKTLASQPSARKPTDNLAARAATSRSRGVDDSKLNKKTEQVALAKRERAKAEPAKAVVASVQAERRETQSQGARRSKEEVRRAMDASKSAIYGIYMRELRKKPSLRGSVTPELVIEASGAVSRCSVVESSLHEPSLEEKICNRIRLINFGARPGVSQTTIRYPIELLPG